MIPNSISPNQAPGGIVGLTFDLAGNEITRSVLSRERAGSVDAMLAADAGEAIRQRGGGSLVAYDGDTGEQMFRGPMIELGEGRTQATHDIESFRVLLEAAKIAGEIPWTVVGVFPTERSDGPPGAWWNSFCYTAGLDVDVELWLPCCSIEDRCMGLDLAATILNRIAAAHLMNVVRPGDTVRVPLGVVDGDDADAMFWIGSDDEPASYRQCNVGSAQRCLPILWSSPLGWR